VIVRHCDHGDDARWDGYVRANAGAHAYHLSAWRRIIETAFVQRTHYLMAERSDGTPVGVLPLVRVRSRLFGDFLVSVPYVNYGGVCADDPETAQMLVAEAIALAEQLGVQHLELRSIEAQAPALRSRSAKVTLRLPLPDTAEQLWKKFPAKLRSQIKRAQQEKMTVQIGREEQLDAFYHVFAINMRDLGTPVYAKGFFAAVLRELPESTWLCTVRVDDEPIAAGFLNAFRNTIEIPWASAQRKYNRLSPNMLLYWSVLEFACHQRFEVFDFGRSSPDSGPFRFKQQWGATPRPLNWEYWVKSNGALPELNPQNPKFQLAVKAWQKLPVAITRIIGPSIVKNIP
jgi:serine/alanine adding enzyme